ncbi:hypothetical protein WJX84_011909 [Apatococcus fuscideae]|uniref:Uncharacterized protein n=1 Tax=Apatococcus fuscideae TaxID=2026836 RepID=A0AAW1RFK7_9CHLO
MQAEPPASTLSLVATDELGFLKVAQSTSPATNHLQCVRRWGKADKSRGIERLALLPSSDAGPDLAAVGRSNGDVDILACQHGTQARLLSCTTAGKVRVHEGSHQAAAGEAGAADSSMAWQQVAEWQAAQVPVCCAAVSSEAGLAAVGCRGSELSLWNISTQQKAFQAKGAKPNKLGLMDPPWNSALAFVPAAAGRKLFVGTGHHKLRLYDVGRARPVLNVDFGEGRLTCLAPLSGGDSCWAADSTGRVQILDARTNKPQSSLKGAGGAVLARMDDLFT